MVNARPGWDADKTLGTYELGPNISAGLPTPEPASLLNAALLNGVHGSIYAIQPQKSTPCADDWSVFLEYRLRPKLALEAGVTSSMGVHLYATYDSNRPSPSPNESVVNYPAQPYTSRIEYLAWGGGPTYYGGQVKLAGELAPLQYGDSGFDILRGPGLATTDVALARTFPSREGLRLQLRAEAHNLQNRTNLALPDRYLGAESSGVISHTITPARQVQFGARLAW